MLQVPVTVLTGFLGAGKTTLLNRILTEKHGKKYAVLINEFAEMGIDDQLVVQTDEEVFEMNNGCICCTVRGDLVRTVEGLMRRTDKFDGMIIETTGLAEPAPVAQTFFADEDVKRFAKLDAIVTVADAKHLPQHWDTPEAIEQLAFADIIILNKADLVSPEELAEVEGRIRAINGQAVLHRTTNCQIDIDQVLNRNAFDLSKIKMDDVEDHHHGHDHGHDHVHDEHCGHDHSHDHHHHHHHDHASGVTSLSLKTDKPIDPDRFEPWIGRVLQLHGADIFRSKGIMNVAGASKRLVFQGVHMQMEHRWGEAWRGRDTRESRIVFIGRNLPADQLREGFLACVK